MIHRILFNGTVCIVWDPINGFSWIDNTGKLVGTAYDKLQDAEIELLKRILQSLKFSYEKLDDSDKLSITLTDPNDNIIVNQSISLPEEKFLEAVNYNSETKELELVFNTTNSGETKKIVVDLQDLMNTYTAGNRINIK